MSTTPSTVPSLNASRRPTADDAGAGRSRGGRGGSHGSGVSPRTLLRSRRVLISRAAAWRRLHDSRSPSIGSARYAPPLITEAMECLGGNGYVEELPLARLYREAPVNAIWEGSGNVMALDVLRVLQKEPDVAAMVMDELGQTAGDDAHLKAAHRRVEGLLSDPRHLDLRARTLVESLLNWLQAPYYAHTHRFCGRCIHRHAPRALVTSNLRTGARLGRYRLDHRACLP